ncbi:Fibronectin type III domain-containing protein [Blastococcus aurantiacus]|uniref:Fibronectin type III domain-containing protein n=1 Tax=Blastococcus aurantiacus TaxID=1550231 RepID=A0A1G7JBG4_9ACTN|nr:fibronectin type III domain-containing protein [Blastococcus aurantiacus]SDF21809.1 Fibronectin type III domain-containing protein [Blastococcus aurantiacus]
MKLPQSALAVAVTAGIVSGLAPFVALAAPPPGAAPPAFALTQVSGGFPGEDDYVEGQVLDTSADGRFVLYKGHVNAWDRAFQPGLFVVDRGTGASRLVWEDPARPGNPGGFLGPDAASLSADGSVVVWTTRDDVVAEPSDVSREAFRTVLADGTTTRIPRSPEAGMREVEAVDVSADGTRAAVLVSDGWGGQARVEVVDLLTGTVVASREVPGASPDLELSADGGTVAWLEHVEGPLDEWENPTWDSVAVVAAADTLEPVASLPDHVAYTPSLDAAGEQVAYVGPEGALLVADLTAAGTPRRAVETAGSGEVHRPQLSGDGTTVVYDERRYEEGSAASAAWAVDLASGAATLVAGTSEGASEDDGSGDEGSGDEGEEPGSVLGTSAFRPVPSHDGTHVVTWLDGKIVMAVETGDAPDTTAPTWPADARLVAEPFDRHTVRLTWPAATDDRQVRGYEITADGAVLTTVGADRTGHDVPLHSDDRAERVVEYGVRALDTSGNASPALTAAARNSAQISVQRAAHDALRVTWEASDDPAVTAYRVLRAAGGQSADGSLGGQSEWEQLADRPTGTTALLDEALPALTWFDYRVDLVMDDGSTRPWATRTSEHTDLPEAVAMTVDQERASSVRVAWPELSASAPLLHYRVEYRQTWPVRETEWTQADLVDRSEERLTTISGLAPRTTYAVRAVAVLDRGWPERPWTHEISATTVSEGITRLDVQAPRTADGAALVLGSDLTATATGEPGLDAELRLWPTSAHTGEPTAVVPMQEPTPGTYVSDPYRLDGTLTAVGWAEVALTDGSRTLTRGTTVAPVSGQLDLEIASSPDDLGALKAVLNGPRGRQELPVTAPGQVSVPLSPGTWGIQLVAGDGEIVASRGVLAVTAGKKVAVALAPVRAAQLDVALTAPNGVPVPAGTLSVRDDQGTLLVQRRMGPATTATVINGLPGHVQLTLDYRFDDQSVRIVQPRVTIDSGTGRSSVPLALAPIPAATTDVTVTGAGKPVGSAAVQLVQTADDRTFTTTATTGGDGRAVLTGLAGAGTLSATADFHTAAAKPVELTADRRGDLTIDLPRTPTYRVQPHLVVVSPDGERVEQPLDWRTASHFHATLRMGSGSTMSGRTMAPSVPYEGVAGDRVELCADGRQAHLPQGCTSIVLGDDLDADITLELAQVGSARAELVDETGTRVANWTASIYRTVAGGRAEYAGARTGNGATPVLAFASAGLYTITWSDSAGRRGTSDVVVDTGTTADLGRVTLSKAAAAPADVTVQSLPDPVMPGALLVVRVSLPASDTVRSQLRVRLPGGTTAQAGTATIDGARAASTVTDGTVVVPLSGRGATTVRVPLTVGSDVLDGELSAPISLRMADGAVLDLPPSSAQVRRVEMEGPTETAGAFTVRGRAPAGTPIAVRDEAGRVLAETSAGAGGRWSTPVQLHAPLEGVTYRLVAVTTAPGPDGGTVELLSEPLDVRYSASDVKPVSITVDNAIADARGRSVTWDPRTGNAAPTLVYVPSVPTKLTARFEDASRVRGFTAYIGSEEQEGSCTATECTATFPPMSSTDVGEIAVGYTVDALPMANGSTRVPTLEEMVATVAHPFNAPEDAVFEVTGRDEYTGRWSVQGMPLVTRSSIGAATELPAPSAADQALAAAAGAPIRGLEVSTPGEGDDKEIVVGAYVATSWLDGGPAGRSVSALMADTKITWKWVEKRLKVGKAFYDLYDISANGANNQQLDALMDHVDLNIRACQPEIAEELEGYIDDAKATLVLHRYATNALDWATLAGGSFATTSNESLGGHINTTIKTLFKGGLTFLGNAFIERAVERVEAVGMKSCDPRVKFVPKEYKPGSWGVGSPTWIFDPSGYVYEALGTQRLEGVTATVLSGPSPQGPWTAWDAEAFGQTNPQSTSVEGTYGWDVPQGWWMVRYEKEGYRTAHSEPLQVLPEHYGVDVDLHRLAPPALSGVTATADGAVEVVFDEWMSSDSVRAGLSVRAGATAVPGTVTAVGEQRSPGDVALARTFRFVPATPFGSGQVLTVTAPGTTLDHGGVTLGADATRTVTAPTRPDGPVSCGALGLSVSPGGQVRKGTTLTVGVSGLPGAQVTLRALTSASVIDWLKAVLTGRLDGARPWVVVGTAKLGTDGKATFPYRADRDTLLQAGQQNCLLTGRIAAVDVK